MIRRLALAVLILVGASILDAASRSGSDGSLPNMAAVDGGRLVPPPVHPTLSGAPHGSAPASMAAHGRPSGGAPQATGEIGSALVGGLATWYDDGPGYYAAAGPLLRDALGPDWRHSLIVVEGPGRLTVVVELVDACACGTRDGLPTILDLSPSAFRELAPLSAGIVAVSIELARELPRTDADIRMQLEVRDDEVYR